ncbi:hypothetical protein CSB37_00890 [bacterium DOLZORAL124_38_8]|nr:MAG: hypothetical protein CSB37_00890 [bacterium DOLZORAL124_38_8]
MALEDFKITKEELDLLEIKSIILTPEDAINLAKDGYQLAVKTLLSSKKTPAFFLEDPSPLPEELVLELHNKDIDSALCSSLNYFRRIERNEIDNVDVHSKHFKRLQTAKNFFTEHYEKFSQDTSIKMGIEIPDHAYSAFKLLTPLVGPGEIHELFVSYLNNNDSNKSEEISPFNPTKIPFYEEYSK